MAGQWTFDTVFTAIPQTDPGLACRGNGRVNEFDGAYPSEEPGPTNLEQSWKDPTAGHPDWESDGTPFGGNLSTGPFALSSPQNPGHIYVFAIGQEGENPPGEALLFWNWEAERGWLGTEGGIILPQSTNAVARVRPVAVQAEPKRLDVFATGSSGTILHWNSADDGASFSAPEALGGSSPYEVIGSPAAVSWGPGRIDVFAATPDGKLLRWFEDGSGFSQFEWIGELKEPCAVSWGPGRLDVFGVASDGAIAHTWFDGTKNPPENFADDDQPETLPGSVGANRPAAVSWGWGTLDVFAFAAKSISHWWRGPDHPHWVGGPDNDLRDIQLDDHELMGGPVCASGGEGNIEVMALAAISGGPYVIDHWSFTV
jgi:hypothetical protein